MEGLTGGTQGVALVPGTGRGYTDDGHAGTAESFDLDKPGLLNLAQTISVALAIIAKAVGKPLSNRGFRRFEVMITHPKKPDLTLMTVGLLPALGGLDGVSREGN